MIASFRAELRKLFTVRSTYVIFLICVAILGLVNVYALGIKGTAASFQDPLYLFRNTFDAVQNLTMLGALVSILLMTHEYRYNTIVYTLTASNSRTKTLLAKIAAVTVYAVLFTSLLSLVSVLLMRLGVALSGHELAPQTFYFQEFIWRALAYGWGTSMFALLFAVLVRSQVAAIALLFLWPTLVENLASLVLHNKVAYLPFRSLDTIISGFSMLPYYTNTEAFRVVLVTLVGGWLVAWILFYRRDAN
jgi:ABC-type transport system involved in multi-copper enzyme maturation permease subunit